MTDNEILARWQGFNPDVMDVEGYYLPKGRVDDYLNDDSAAMSLLDTLVAKGFNWKLEGYHNDNTWFEINKPYDNRTGDWTIAGQWKHTRREAVVAACLELIGREDV